MIMRRKPRPLSIGKVASRATAMQSHELWTWAEAETMGVGAAFDAWRSGNGPYEEIDRCLQALGALCSELDRRSR